MKKIFWLLLFLAAPASLPAFENITVGQEPATFSLPSLAGSSLSLDYFEGGSGVIIFWSTWSPRSLELLESFKGYYESGGIKGLKVIAVNAGTANCSPIPIAMRWRGLPARWICPSRLPSTSV